MFKVAVPIYKLVARITKSKNLMTLTDVILRENLIYCSYNFVFATRNLHFHSLDYHLLPKTIITSFAYKYFSESEKCLLLACDACNDVIEFRKNNPTCNVVQVSTGSELVISVFNQQTNNYKEFKIDNLSKFTGLCRKYRTPTEVEKIITAVFKIR